MATTNLGPLGNRRSPPARGTQPFPPLPAKAPRSAYLLDPVVSLVAAHFSTTRLQRLRGTILDAWGRAWAYVFRQGAPAADGTANVSEFWTPTGSWNDGAKTVLDMVNAVRLCHGLPRVQKHFGLWLMAADRSNDMAYHQYFSHTDACGKEPEARFKAQGLRYDFGGENIAYGQLEAEEVMRDWMNSPTHRANILNPNFKYLGVGVGQDVYGRLFWTQLFSG